MFKNYIIIAFRSLFKNKTTAIINIIGLALGMTGCMLILNYVSYDKSFDRFHDNAGRIYRVTNNITNNGEPQGERAIVFPAIGPTMSDYFPEVVDYARIHAAQGVVTYGDKTFREDKMFYADPSFLTMFSFPLVKGEASSALKEAFTAVISESAADKYFDDEDPIGKSIEFKDQNFSPTYTISGVMKDVPENSHIQFDFLLSYETLALLSRPLNVDAHNSWMWDMFYTYVMLKPEAAAESVEAGLSDYTDKYLGERQKISGRVNEFSLQPLLDIHLYSNLLYEAGTNSNGEFIYFLLLISFFILIIGWINYINIATARANSRAKEVGIRKVMGAHKEQLVKQYLFEAFLHNILALLIAFIILTVSLPFFSELLERPTRSIITFLGEINAGLWLSLLAFFILGSLLSGAYSAFMLTAFKPIEVLNGRFSGKHKGINFRKALIVFQFGISVALITGTIIVYKQIQFMRKQDLGIAIDKILVLESPNLYGATSSSNGSGLDFFKTELVSSPSISSLTVSSNVPGREHDRGANGIRRVNSDVKEGKFFNIMGIDPDFLPTYHLQLLAGRNFSKESGANRKSAIINKTAVKMLGFDEPEDAISEEIIFSGAVMKIIGVVDNYHHQSLKKSIAPIIFFPYVPSDNDYYSLKVSTDDVDETLALIKEKWNVAFPEKPYEYFFLDDYFNRQYKADQRFGKMFTLFSLLAVFVACLGLFGFSSYSMRQRVREVSIRKVLGASFASNLMLLLNQSLKLVLIAFVLACPVVYYLSDKWLENYPFPIEQDVFIYLLAGVVVALIAVFTVIFQVVKTVRANPATTLRNE